MKKIRLFLPLIILFFIGGNAWSQQVTEGFEKQYFPPAGWQVVHVKGSNSWESSVYQPHQGLRSAFIRREELSGADGGEGDNWLILPKIINVQPGDNLTFFVKAESDDTYGPPFFDSLEVLISVTNADLGSFTDVPKRIPMNSFGNSYKSYSVDLTAYQNKDIFIAFRNHQSQGTGLYLDDVVVSSKLPIDIGSKNINLGNNAVFPVGASISISDTLQNYGSSPLPSGIPVSYTVNGGPKITLSTTAAINPGQTHTVVFSGANAFVPPSAGTYILKVFTDYGSDLNKGNDTIKYVINVQTAVTTFPSFQDFSSLGEWTVAGSADFHFVDEVNLAGPTYPVINPNGQKGIAALAETYTSADIFYLRSPLLNFSGVGKPLMNFYVTSAYNDSKQYDQLDVLVSTDGGESYDVVPLYTKSENTTSKLVTVPDPHLFFVPDNANSWRHEIVDLSKYAGMTNIMVAFKVSANFGNNVYIDNVNFIDQDPLLYTSMKVTGAGQIVGGAYNTKVKFNTIVAADSTRIEGNDVAPSNNTFDDNTTATNPAGGEPETPDYVFDRYFTIAYSGNSITKANYNISLDVTGLSGLPDLDKLYILKRADQTAAWVALTTTRSGNVLTATGLNQFSEFTIGYKANPVPVTLLSFSGHVVGNAVMLLWNTSQEINIDSYEVQRWNGVSWISLGSITSAKIALQNKYDFTDKAPLFGMNLYRLKITSEIGSVVYSEVAKVQFENFSNKVYQNVPNPFRNQTTIKFDVAKQSRVKVIIYGVNGSQVAVLENGEKPAGSYTVQWQAGNIPAGTYFYKVIINDEVYTKSMLKIY